MAKIEIPAKIRTEDYPAEMQETVEKLGSVYNPFVDQVYQALNGRLDYDNLNRQIVTIDLSTNATGKLINPPQIKYLLNTRLKGTNVLSAQNLINTTIYPVSHPFLSTTINGQFVIILNISGLQINSSYRLTVELIG